MTDEKVPTLEDFPPEALRSGEFVMNQAPTTIIVNTNLVSEDPVLFEDLLTPEYKDPVLVGQHGSGWSDAGSRRGEGRIPGRMSDLQVAGRLRRSGAVKSAATMAGLRFAPRSTVITCRRT